jgi:hypothetical protein
MESPKPQSMKLSRLSGESFTLFTQRHMLHTKTLADSGTVRLALHFPQRTTLVGSGELLAAGKRSLWFDATVNRLVFFLPQNEQHEKGMFKADILHRDKRKGELGELEVCGLL